MVNEEAFASQPILQVFVSLIMRHRDAIAHTLRTDAVYTPLLLQDQDGVACGNDWANGFVRGMPHVRKRLLPKFYQLSRFAESYRDCGSTSCRNRSTKPSLNIQFSRDHEILFDPTLLALPRS
jgi:hypothetical protein